MYQDHKFSQNWEMQGRVNKICLPVFQEANLWPHFLRDGEVNYTKFEDDLGQLSALAEYVSFKISDMLLCLEMKVTQREPGAKTGLFDSP